MKDFFIEMVSYHHQTNQKLISQLEQNQSNLSPRTIPLFSHMLNAHQIWNARILGNNTFGVNDVHSLVDFQPIDKENFNNTCQIIEDYDLQAEHSYVNSLGQKFQNSIQDILFHACNHHAHHRGQIISDLRQNGIEPILTDYIFYKRK